MAKTAFEQIGPSLNRDEGLLWCGRPQRTILDRFAGCGAERTAYAVTKRRVIVDRHPHRSELWSAPLDAIDELSFRAGSSGAGTIFCARRCLPWIGLNERRGSTTTALFRRISDVDAVYALLTEARNAYGVVTTTRWRAPGVMHQRYRG